MLTELRRFASHRSPSQPLIGTAGSLARGPYNGENCHNAGAYLSRRLIQG